MTADISVVIPTHDRPAGLARLLAGLRGQSIDRRRYEVIIVDDGSRAPVDAPADGLPVQIIRHQRPRGPAAARNSGWRAAQGPIVAFIDDDCAPADGWLEGMLGACDGPEEMVVQGRVAPMPDQVDRLRPLSHTIEVQGLSSLFVSANIAYRRSLLERLGGFDETFTRACGEDAELGARAMAAGAVARFASDALVYHEVRELGLADHLRHTVKWTDSVRVRAMHPELRRLLIAGVFWKQTHPWLLACAAALLARRRRLVMVPLLPYLLHYWRVYEGDSRELGRCLPRHLAIDVCEIATAVAGSVRYRTLML